MASDSVSSGERAAEYRDVSVRFGVTRALTGLDLEIKKGTIHAFVGENGAGKSTALGVLAGRVAASSGEVFVFGQRLPPLRPRDARRAGVAAIYQELTIAPDLDAAANVFAGQELRRFGFLAIPRMRRAYEALAADLGVRSLPPDTLAGSVSVAEQQLLEIMRAMASDSRLILFDEPTASLGMPERRALLALMRRLRAEGRTVVFVSHNLEEILDVADTVSVFRAGRVVSTLPRPQVTKKSLVREMLGDHADPILARTMDGARAAARPRVNVVDAPVLRVEGLTVPGAIEDISLSVHAGETLGLGGLVGSGRTTVLRALAGAEPRARGRMWVSGREVPWPTTFRHALALGIALAPEDRKGQGLVLDQSSEVNVTMSDLGAVSRFGWVSDRRVRAAAQAAVAPFGFDPNRVATSARQLSGGNQQKLLLARWRFSMPKILLADEPTRGIDIGAKEDVLSALREMAGRGLAIVFVSSELEEVVAVSDRVEVLAEGRQMGSLDRSGGALSVSAILDRTFSA